MNKGLLFQCKIQALSWTRWQAGGRAGSCPWSPPPDSSQSSVWEGPGQSAFRDKDRRPCEGHLNKTCLSFDQTVCTRHPPGRHADAQSLALRVNGNLLQGERALSCHHTVLWAGGTEEEVKCQTPVSLDLLKRLSQHQWRRKEKWSRVHMRPQEISYILRLRLEEKAHEGCFLTVHTPVTWFCTWDVYCLKSLTNPGAATHPVSVYSAPAAGEAKRTRRSWTL